MATKLGARGTPTAGRRALVFSLIAHVVLALALLFEFLTVRARDARRRLERSCFVPWLALPTAPRRGRC